MIANCTAYAAAVTPAQGVINSVYAAIVVPELAGQFGSTNYQPANGSIIQTSGAVPPTTVQRVIWEVSGIVEVGASVTAGALNVYQLGLDGNWHVMTAPLTLVASTKYWFSIGLANVSGGSWTFNALPPCLGVAFVFSTALVGGNVSFAQILGLTNMADSPIDV